MTPDAYARSDLVQSTLSLLLDDETPISVWNLEGAFPLPRRRLWQRHL